MNLLPKFLIKKHSDWKVSIISPLLKKNEKVLDFGCGDLSFAKKLRDVSQIDIQGVDVIDTISPDKMLRYTKYDGKILPFKDNSFDTVISFYVFHHCDDPEQLLQECVRVAKKKIIIGESTFRSVLEIPGMRFVDWLANVIKFQGISLPYKFYSLNEWMQIFKKNNLKFVSMYEITKKPLSLLPIGKSYVFVVEKNN